MSGDSQYKKQEKVRGPEWWLHDKNKLDVKEVKESEVRAYMPEGPQRVSVSNLAAWPQQWVLW